MEQNYTDDKREPYVCPTPISTFTAFSDEGLMHFRAGKFRKALFCFDRALQLQPGHKGALVLRSQCHLKLGDAASALKDAQDSCSDHDLGNIKGLYQYGEALFNLGQFEQALISYHRGFRMRKDREEFRVGVNKAQDAINRAIGDVQATQIEDLDTILPKVDELESDISHTEHCCILQELGPKKKADEATKPTKNTATLARDRWVDREILGVLQQDKDYLTKFLKRPDIKGDTQSSSENLRYNAHEALNYLEIREKFWRMQSPMYSRKIGLTFNNDMVRQYEKQEADKMEASRRIKMDAAQGSVLKNISQIEHALKIGRAHDSQLECERALKQINKMSLHLLPRKPHFMTEILHYKGLAMMKLKNFDGAAASFLEEYQVAIESRMPEIKSRALDFVGRSYALKGSYAEAAEAWDSRLNMAKTPIERAYLFHELGRCYYEMSRFELSRMFANQCSDEAAKISDVIWQMNAYILLGQCDVKTKQFAHALELFEKAEEFAMACNNKSNCIMLREAQHCIKLYLDKEEQGNAAPLSKAQSVPESVVSDDDDVKP